MNRSLSPVQVPAPTAYGRRALEALLDVGLIALSYYTAYRLRFDARQFEGNYPLFIQSLPIILVCRVVSFFVVGVYRGVWRYFRPSDVTTYFKGIALGGVSSIVMLLFLYRFESYSRIVFLIDAVLLMLLLVGSRMSFRVVGNYVSRHSAVGSRVLIYGAGDGGVLLARELLHNRLREYRPIGFIDDDPNKERSRIAGLKVVGGVSGLAASLERHRVEAVILSTKKIYPPYLRELHRICTMTGTPLIAMRFSLEPVEIDPEGSVRRFPSLIDSTGRQYRAVPAAQSSAASQVATLSVPSGVAMAPDALLHGTPASRPRPIRVAHVATRLNLGGVTRHILNLYRYMPADRIEMRIIAGSVTRGEAEWIDAIREAGVMPWSIPELRRPIAPIDDLVAFYKLWRFFLRWKPDVVHTHMAKAGALGRIAALLAGVPVRVHSFHGHVFRGYFGRVGSGAARAAETLLGRFTTGVVTVTPGQHDEIVAELRIVAERRTRLIRYGCETGGTVSVDVRDGWRRELGIASDAFVAVTVGRLTPIKNHALLLEALAKCALPVVAVIVGDGELRGELERRAKALGIAKRTVFAGWIDDVTVAYQAADVLTLTSHNEGAPIAVMEAMGWGCPVVATRAGGVPDLIDDTTGILVDLGDSNALAAALDALARDPERAKRMGAAARVRALTDFSVEREAGSILEYYEALLASSHRLAVHSRQAAGQA